MTTPKEASEAFLHDVYEALYCAIATQQMPEWYTPAAKDSEATHPAIEDLGHLIRAFNAHVGEEIVKQGGNEACVIAAERVVSNYAKMLYALKTQTHELTPAEFHMIGLQTNSRSTNAAELDQFLQRDHLDSIFVQDPVDLRDVMPMDRDKISVGYVLDKIWKCRALLEENIAGLEAGHGQPSTQVAERSKSLGPVTESSFHLYHN